MHLEPSEISIIERHKKLHHRSKYASNCVFFYEYLLRGFRKVRKIVAQGVHYTWYSKPTFPSKRKPFKEVCSESSKIYCKAILQINKQINKEKFVFRKKVLQMTRNDHYRQFLMPSREIYYDLSICYELYD